MASRQSPRQRAGFWSAYPARTRPGATRWFPATIAALGAVLVWWLITTAGLIDSLYLPGPFEVLERMGSQVRNGVAIRYLTPTIIAALLGVVIAIFVALPLGVLIAHSQPLAAIIEPFVAISQTVPLVAIAPLLVLWIGYGTVPIAVLCAVIAFFPIVTTTVVGLRSLDMRAVEHAMIDGASFRQRLIHIEMPMAAPAVLAGMRGGGVLAMTGAVVGELVMGGQGLGTLLTLARQSADTTAVFAVIFWIGLVAMGLYGLVQIAERSAVAKLQGETT